MNKANTSGKETSFLDLSLKLTDSDVHINVDYKYDDFGFPIVNFPWLSGDVPRLHRKEFTFLSWLDLQGVVLPLLNFHSKIFTSKLLTQGYRYHKLRKIFGKFFRLNSKLLSKFGGYRFNHMFLKESLTRSYTVIWSTN